METPEEDDRGLSDDKRKAAAISRKNSQASRRSVELRTLAGDQGERRGDGSVKSLDQYYVDSEVQTWLGGNESATRGFVVEPAVEIGCRGV